MTELIQEMLAWIAANPHWAYLIIFLVAMTESLALIGMLVPGAVMMVGAGPPIAAGVLSFWPVMAWAVGGAIVGDGLSYWLGHHFRERLRLMWPFSRYPDSLSRGERFFEQYGGKSVAFGRFVGPVRAVIPVVAGMMGMDPKRFLVANVASAIAWAPAYIVPGIVLGASLELAAEATARLGVLALVLILTLWLVFWGVHRLFLFYSPRAGRWVKALLTWADVHPRLGEIARALADADHPDARTLAGLAGLLLLATLAFALMMGLAMGAAPELRLNQIALNLALSLHTPGANHLMAAANRLGDLAVILPLGGAVLIWLLAQGQRRQATYWIAALAFGLLAAPLLKWLLQVPRPDIGLEGLSPWAFPSSHMLRATVIYGFLAVCLAGAGAMPQAWRWLPYALAALLATAVGISGVYFGAHWLTDVIGGLALGLAWVAALGLSFRRHTRPAPSWHGLAALSSAVLVLAFGITSLSFHASDLALYQPKRDSIALPEAQWRAQDWLELPQWREDIRGTNGDPMNLQYAGDPQVLTRGLTAQGWRTAETLSFENAVRLLSPSLPLMELPLIPHVHDGHHEDLGLVKPEGEDGRLVLRLWATPYLIDGRQPLWIGNVTSQHKRLILNLLAIPATEKDTATALSTAALDFGALHPERPAADGPWLLEGMD
jgi:membrane protein DedA with SNARE-associated domain